MQEDKHNGYLRMSQTSNQEREVIEAGDAMDFAAYLARFNNK